MPWQQLVADVAGEYDDDGRPYWREVICTVPRQSGKSTLLLAHELEVCLRIAGARVFYSAQTGWDARRKLIDDQAPMLQGSPLNASVKRVLRGAGNEAIIFKNGSRVDVMATSSSSGHGRTMDMGVIDEAFDDTDDRREQAMIPAMATRPHAQLWVVSTMGTNQSTYLNRKVEAGRAAVADDLDSGIAYFEWSADPDDDLEDESTWTGFMPALGRTIGTEAVRHAKRSMSTGEFRRAYGNIPTQADDRVIPADVWNAVVAANAAPEGRMVFAVDVAPDRSSAAVAVSDGFTAEVVEHRAGVSWVVPRVAELARKHRLPVVLDGKAAAGSLADELEAEKITVRSLSTDEVASASGRFFDRVFDGDVQLRSHAGLSQAAAGAARRNLGDRWVWGRRNSTVDITPLVAVTLALWAREDSAGAPVVSFV